MSVSANELVDEALVCLREGRLHEGAERLERAIAIQPELVKAWGNLSVVHMLEDRHEEALHCLEQVLRLDPHNLDARWRRADRLVRLGRLEEAGAQYREVLELEPSCHDARCGLRYMEWLKRKSGIARGKSQAALEDEEETKHLSAEPDRETARRRKTENEQRAAEHFARGDLRLTSLPAHLHLETTTRCNATCIMCRRLYLPVPIQDLRPEVFARIEKELLPTVVSVNLSGIGEPTLGRGFDRFFEAAARCGVRIHFVTNGTALSLARLERFARRTSHMVVSVDGAKRETFESIRRDIRFDRVIESLRLYKKMRDLYPEAGSTLAVNFVAMRRNIEELPAVIDLAADVGAHLVFVAHVGVGDLTSDMAAEQLSYHPELANRMFDEAAERARQRGITLQAPPKFSPATAPTPSGPAWVERFRRATRLLPQRRRFPQRCALPWTSPFISVGGLVHPCCGSLRVLGELSCQSFEEVWNRARYRRFRRRINTFLPPLECRHCQLAPGINAGNAAEVLAREGLLVKLFYRAEVFARELVNTIRRLSRRKDPTKIETNPRL